MSAPEDDLAYVGLYWSAWIAIIVLLACAAAYVLSAVAP